MAGNTSAPKPDGLRWLLITAAENLADGQRTPSPIAFSTVGDGYPLSRRGKKSPSQKLILLTVSVDKSVSNPHQVNFHGPKTRLFAGMLRS